MTNLLTVLIAGGLAGFLLGILIFGPRVLCGMGLHRWVNSETPVADGWHQICSRCGERRRGVHRY